MNDYSAHCLIALPVCPISLVSAVQLVLSVYVFVVYVFVYLMTEIVFKFIRTRNSWDKIVCQTVAIWTQRESIWAALCPLTEHQWAPMGTDQIGMLRALHHNMVSVLKLLEQDIFILIVALTGKIVIMFTFRLTSIRNLKNIPLLYIKVEFTI